MIRAHALKMLDPADLQFARGLLFSRHFWDAYAWVRSRRDQEYLLKTASPWITFPAIRWLRRFLARTTAARVFEYGSGGSTLFWLRYGCECTSVEHDATWLATVRARAPERQLDLRFVPPDPLPPNSVHDPADPGLYQSSSPAYARCEFRRYVKQIDEFPDAHFDVVLVDGRARPSCIVHALPKLRVGGALVVDNTERPHYLQRTLPLLKDWQRIQLPGPVPTLNMFNQTDVFVRRR